MAGGGEHHPGEAQDRAADCALEGDGTHPSTDVHELVHFLRELSITTTPAASVITSLICPMAMPTEAAIMAGASLMPSPT